MGVIQLSDELHHLIDRAVQEGRATSPAALVTEAVERLIEDGRLEEDEIGRCAAAGIADIEAGRYTLIETPHDGNRLRDRLMTGLRNRLASAK